MSGLASPAEAKFVIAGERFRYKKDVEQRIRSIKDSAPLRTNLEGQDAKFVRAFFHWHPTKNFHLMDAAAVRVVPGLSGNDWRFDFILEDGRSMDASYKKPLSALTGLDYHRNSVLDAMRFTAHAQAWEWAVETYGQDAYTGDYHVHHEPPFRELVKRFLKEEGATHQGRHKGAA